MKKNNKNFIAAIQYQLRGMAILEQYQKQHYGKYLLEEAIETLKTKSVDLIWCNARESAINFYLKQGFTIKGSSFDIPKIGPHYLMFKNI